jgi:DNA polymerase III subunit gamma/tau
MSYLVLARKWRPQRFSDVVGQSHVTKTLANAIEMDRVAHAFLFSGVRGVGKTSLARILAKSLNCKDGPTPNPCGTCDSCRAVTAGTAVDVIEIDGASNNSVEDIRNLRETVPFRPVLGRYKVYVIDEVHMLSTSAFNALLKTLEEPPPHVKFIFATTESHKIPVTILSRCQRYDFRRIPTSAVIGRLVEILNNEKISFEQGALALIGREAEGSMRDALSTLDQVLAACGDKITTDSVSNILGVVERKVYYELSNALLHRNSRRCLEIIKETDRQGYEMTTFSKGLLEHLRNLVVAGVCKGDKAILDLADDEIAELSQQAGSVSPDALHRLFKHFSEAYESIVRSQHPKILLETALARIADMGELVPAHEILARLERLASGGGASSGGALPGGGRPGGFSSGSRGNAPPSPRGPVHSALPSVSSKVDSSMHAASRNVPVRPQPASVAPRPVEVPPKGRDTASDAASSQRGALPSVEISEGMCQKIIGEMKQAKPAMASVLGCCRFETSSGGISLLFSKEYASIAALAEDRTAEMAAYFQQHLGCEVRVKVRVCDTVDAPSAAKQRIEAQNRRREKEDQAVQHPLIRQIQSEFGGKISGVQITENPRA